jgi:hypothetical protein
MTTPRAAEIWRKVLDARLQDLHTALPCEIVSFDTTAQTAVLQPLIKSVTRDIDNREIEESYPQLVDVPICWPRAGGFVITYPLAAGDIVTALFHEADLGRFLETGAESRALMLERHALSGVVALPFGPYPYASTIGETIDGLVLGADGGAVIRIKDDGTVQIGASGSAMQAIALAEDVKAQLQVIVDAISGGVPVAQDGGENLQATIVAALSDPVPSVGSTKAEVEE